MNYRPELKSIRVSLDKLLLDPNNPRILSGTERLIDEKNYPNAGVQRTANMRMIERGYKIDELEQSILKNGWQPVDMIFVKKLSIPNEEQYVVLEGNRRLTALRNIKDKGKLSPEIQADVDPLPVVEVVGTKDMDESRAQITYLLGVRHHGSLKIWTAFAQADNIYQRYLHLGNMTDETFKWNPVIALRVAQTLNIDEDTVEQRLKVYRVMKQLELVPQIKKIGIQGRFYTLIREVLQGGGALKQYIVQDSSTFLLDSESVNRMDTLCKFSVAKREGAPINNPDEWRPLEKILKDEDKNKVKEMVGKVENGEQPSTVWTERSAELSGARWDLWLNKVADLLKSVTIAQIDSTNASNTASRFAKVMDALEKKIKNTKGK